MTRHSIALTALASIMLASMAASQCRGDETPSERLGEASFCVTEKFRKNTDGYGTGSGRFYNNCDFPIVLFFCEVGSAMQGNGCGSGIFNRVSVKANDEEWVLSYTGGKIMSYACAKGKISGSFDKAGNLVSGKCGSKVPPGAKSNSSGGGESGSDWYSNNVSDSIKLP
jgi:hypothetical protein